MAYRMTDILQSLQIILFQVCIVSQALALFDFSAIQANYRQGVSYKVYPHCASIAMRCRPGIGKKNDIVLTLRPDQLDSLLFELA